MTFERYTDRARRSLALAGECARALNHAEVGTGHMLAGLMAEGGGVAYQALSALGLDADAVPAYLDRYALVLRCPPGAGQDAERRPFTPRGKRACEAALHEALKLGHSYVGTEHVLLALTRDSEGTGAADVLVALGVDPQDARAKVLELLRGYDSTARGKAAESPPAPPDVRSDEEMKRLGDAFLSAHQATCERCATLALLCPGCREAFGECIVRGQIERLLVREVRPDGT